MLKASILQGRIHWIIILKAMRHNTGTEMTRRLFCTYFYREEEKDY